MEVREALLCRRSVRKFTEQAVSEEEISELLHAAMSGPSAVNARPWAFYAVTNPDALAGLRKSSKFTNMNAPLAIVVCGNKSHMLPLQLEEFWVQDCSAATENILLRAVDLGLGAVWCGIYPQKAAVKKVSEALSLPGSHIPLNILFIGHPAETPEPRDQYNEKNVFFVK